VGGRAVAFAGAVMPPIMLPIDARSRSACSIFQSAAKS
jgi:hypothetical protein